MTTRVRLGQIATPGASDGDMPSYDAATDQLVMGPPTGGVQSIVAGTDIGVDNTDPANPVVSYTGTGGGGGSGAGSRVDDPADTLWSGSTTYDVEFDTDTTSLPSGWSWVNQGSMTYEQKFGMAVLLHPTTTTGGAAIRGITRSLPAGSTWTATIKLNLSTRPTGNTILGFALRDSATGKMQLFGLQYSGGQRVHCSNWNSATSFSADVQNDAAGDYPRYLRIKRNSSTSYEFEQSMDGVAWTAFRSAHNPTTFVTPDQIGLVVYQGDVNKVGTTVEWFRVR